MKRTNTKGTAMFFRKGFTLIEMLLSVACIAIIIGMSVPIHSSLTTTSDTDITVNGIVDSFRRAQILSQSASGDSGWGVYVATGSILIYKGTTYNSRDVAYDESTDISPSIVVTGLREVSFSKIYGFPTQTGTTTVTSINNDVRTITINQKGTIDY